MTAAALARLTALLERESRAIRGGVLHGSPDMADEIAALVREVEAAQTPAPADQTVALREAAERLRRDLASAIGGLRSARARIAEMRRVAETLDTYDDLGRARTILGAASSVERRA